ncbi:hypothetical protein [Streptomyces sp. NPDC004008]
MLGVDYFFDEKINDFFADVAVTSPGLTRRISSGLRPANWPCGVRGHTPRTGFFSCVSCR